MTEIDNELTFRIIGQLFEVHNKLGHLHQEKHYQRAISVVFDRETIKYEREKAVDIRIDTTKIGHYKLDFVIEKKLILETKTTNIKLTKYHNQILSYMNQLQIRIGLLVNFRTPKLEIRRLILPDKYIVKSL